MKQKIIIISVILITILAIGFIGSNKSNYNEGICPTCGIKYKERSYVYDGKSWLEFKCEQCGKQGIIQERFIFQKTLDK